MLETPDDLRACGYGWGKAGHTAAEMLATITAVLGRLESWQRGCLLAGFADGALDRAGYALTT